MWQYPEHLPTAAACVAGIRQRMCEWVAFVMVIRRMVLDVELPILSAQVDPSSRYFHT
jgi:hypothetical protein